MIEQDSTLDRASALQETLVSIFVVGETDRATLGSILARFVPEDIASVLEDFEPSEKVEIFRSIEKTEDQGVVLEETDPQSHREILDALTETERREVIGEMPVDDMVDHLQELPSAERQRIIATLAKDEAEDVEELLRYDAETAGGMMTTEFLTIPVGSSSREGLEQIQGNLSAEANYVYVTEPDEKLLGVVSIKEIVRASPGDLIDSYMERDIVKVRVETDREAVSAKVHKHNLQALPVLDREGRIRGIVTFDDVIEALQEENTEDMMRMAGTTALHPLYEPIRVDILKRLPFLLVTTLGGITVMMVLDTFRNNYLERDLFASMVIWSHLVSALSGNVAVVTSTVIVRGLATGEIGTKRIRRALIREFSVSLLIAATLAVIVTGVFYIHGRSQDELPYTLSHALLAVGAAMLVSLGWAGLMGGTIPVLCRKLNIDPAIASGPFVTMTCDISASVIFLCFVYALLVV